VTDSRRGREEIFMVTRGRNRRRLFAAVIASLALWHRPAEASSFTLDVTLEADALGDPAFGITSVPAGPFFASFTFSGPLAADQLFTRFEATALSVQIGDFDFTLNSPDFDAFLISTDSSGQPTAFHFEVLDATSARIFSLDKGFAAIDWFAGDFRDTTRGCAFSQSPPLTIVGQCIGGSPGTAFVRVVESPSSVPEPSTLVLLVSGIAVRVMQRRRCRIREHGGGR
jgi:hypothetical protein